MTRVCLLLAAFMGVALADTPVTYPGPGVPEPSYEAPSYEAPTVSVVPREPHPSYGAPQYAAAPEKGYVPISYAAPDDNAFGIETGYQGILVPALEAATAAVTGSSPNPLASANPLAAILSASSDLLANTDISASYPGLFGSSSILSKPWFWGLAPKIASTILKKLGTYLLKFAFVVFLGGGFTVAVCTFTPICTLSFLGFGLTRRSITDSMRAYITQDRLSALTTYITEAIEKYRAMQLKSHDDKSGFLKKTKPVKKASDNVAEARIEDESPTIIPTTSTTTSKPNYSRNVHNSPRANDDEFGDIPPEQIL